MVAALLLAFCPSAPAQTIISLEAVTQYADSLVVIRASGLERGDVLTRDNLATAIRRIHATTLFSQVEAETTMIADGVRVRFRVSEHLRLKPQGVHFIGNHKVRTKDLLGKVGAKDKDLLTEERIFDWTRKVNDVYKSGGYALAKCTTQVTPPDVNGMAEVNFFIEEGDEIRIKEIRIKGAQAISEKKLRSKMANKGEWWPWRKGKFNDEEFKKDLERIVDFYKENGFIDARVIDYDLKYDGGREYITINVSEGIRYYFGRVEFSGESLFTRDELTAAVKVKPAAVYNQKRLNQGVSELYALYSEQGFIYTNIQPVDSVRGDTVDIRVRIAENQPARIRLVTIEGNDRTLEKVIRREIVSMPGSMFKRSEVVRSQQNVFNLGFFEDIQLDYKKVSDSTGDIDLSYKVKEKFAGTVGAGVTYSGTDGLVGYVELAQPNLFGRSQKLHVKYEKGATKQNVELGFTEPWCFDTPTAAGASLFWTNVSYDNYDKRDRGGEANFSRPLPLDYSRGYFTFHLGDVTLSNIKSSSGLSAGDTLPKTTVSTTFRFDRDSRDYIFNPSSGSYNSYTAVLAGGPWGGDVHFHKHILESNVYYPLFWKFSLRLRGRFGVVSGLGTGDTVPLYERFSPGGTGVDGVRGYGDASLPNLTGYNNGGMSEAIFSLEYRLRITRGLAVLAFLDAGNAWPSVRDINFSELKRGAGAGVRLEIPMVGWLGFDLGYGFDRPGGSKWEPHFWIGTGLNPTGF